MDEKQWHVPTEFIQLALSKCLLHTSCSDPLMQVHTYATNNTCNVLHSKEFGYDHRLYVPLDTKISATGRMVLYSCLITNIGKELNLANLQIFTRLPNLKFFENFSVPFHSRPYL